MRTRRAQRPPRPGRRFPHAALVVGLVACGAVLSACSVRVGGDEGPSVGVGGVATPGETPASDDATLREQLRDELMALFRAEERYFAQHDTYTDDLYALRGDAGGGYYPGPGVRVRIPTAGDDGFSAIATRAHVECALRVGDVPPPRSWATAKRVVVCRPEGRPGNPAALGRTLDDGGAPSAPVAPLPRNRMPRHDLRESRAAPGESPPPPGRFGTLDGRFPAPSADRVPLTYEEVHMLHPHGPRRLAVAAATLALSLAVPVHAQMGTADHAPASVEEHLEMVRAYLAEMHGPLAQRLYEAHTTQLTAPHDPPLPPRLPSVPARPHHVGADRLVHHQAASGVGSLGRLHGTSAHPIGVGWFPHSMFSQGGGVYARWGHARLLHAVQRFVALQTQTG